MAITFTWDALPSRVIFGAGSLLLVAGEVDRLGADRVLLIGSGPSTRDALARLRTVLRARVAAEIAKSPQHVPEHIADAAATTARDADADIVVSVGGGSATGLGKAVAVACNLPLIAVPTTYAGSEMTATWGRTSSGVKHTGTDPRALARAVLYDPELCRGMPIHLAAASGMNAMAHCAEALWAAGSNPITTTLAEEGIRRLVAGLPRVVVDTDDLDAHAGTLVGACLAGLAFAQAGSGIHHRACHVLGGGWNLPHAETHAVVLPHAVSLVAPRAPDAVRHLGHVLGTDRPAGALFEMVQRLALPTSLRALGMPADGLDEAAERVMASSREDPLVPNIESVRHMLDGAFSGRAPSG